MSELTINRLSLPPSDEASKPSHSKKRPVTSIIEWTQCFTNCIAILVQAQPSRTTDLLGYQHLILEAHLEYVSARSQLHSQQPFGLEGTDTCGIWSLQIAFVNLTVITVLAPPTPQSSVAGPQTPRREWCQNHASTNRGFAKIGTTHNVYSLDVSLSMLACIVIRDSNHRIIHCPTNSSRQQELL